MVILVCPDLCVENASDVFAGVFDDPPCTTPGRVLAGRVRVTGVIALRHDGRDIRVNWRCRIVIEIDALHESIGIPNKLDAQPTVTGH